MAPRKKKEKKEIEVVVDPNRIKHVYGYARTSKLKQIDRYSIETQNQAIMKYCKDNELKLTEIFEDVDFGLSTTDRDEFQELMSYLQNGDSIIIYDLACLSRSSRDIFEFIEEFITKRKCVLICLNPRCDTDDFNGRYLIQATALFIDNESRRFYDHVQNVLDLEQADLIKELEDKIIEKSEEKISLMDVMTETVKKYSDQNYLSYLYLQELRNITKDDDHKIVELLSQTFDELLIKKDTEKIEDLRKKDSAKYINPFDE